MAIERSLYEMPQGLPDEGVGIDIELELGDAPTEIVMLEDGGAEITISPEETPDEELALAPFDANLAEYLDDAALQELSTELLGMVEADIIAARTGRIRL